MNRIMVIGNLTRDPEKRETQSGVPVCNFTIAVNRRHRDANGESIADFFNVIAWRQQAEACGMYLSKGRKVGVSGELQMRKYTDRNGVERTTFEIQADEVEFLTPANAGANAAAAQGTARPQQRPAQQQQRPARQPDRGYPDSTFTHVEDDDLPF